MEKVADNGERWRTLIGLISMVAGGLFLVGTIPGQAAAGTGGPPGNDGTVKIDRVVFDDHPDNEPHVGCVFQVDFYGYDEGRLFADVTFRVHPPTGNEVILEDKDIFIGEDDHSGGGSEPGLDASRTYDLTAALAKFEPEPQQGWHVKLTVDADGSQGADVKHKTFWVSGCEASPTTSSSTTSTTGSTTTTTEKPTTTSESTTSTTEEATTTTESPTTSTSTTSTTEEPTTTIESTTTSTSTTSTTEEPTSTSESTTTSTSTTSTTEEPTSTSESTTTSSIVPESSTESPTTSSIVPESSTSSTSVVPSAAVTPAVGAGRLPDTGTDSDGLLGIAGLALVIGGAALFASTKVSRQSS